MCEMTTMLAIASIGSTVMQVQAQNAAYKQQRRLNDRQYQADMQAERYNQAQINTTRVQEAQNTAEQKLENNRAAERAKATARVAAGEAGIAGLSVDALLADIEAKAGRDNMTADVNYLRQDQALQAQAANNRFTTISNVNSYKSPVRPDYLGAALRIGTTANDTWGNRGN
jgi:hypothetical protein